MYSRGPPPGHGQPPGHWLPRGSWPQPGLCELRERLFYITSTSNPRRLDDQCKWARMVWSNRKFFCFPPNKETTPGCFEGKKSWLCSPHDYIVFFFSHSETLSIYSETPQWRKAVVALKNSVLEGFPSLRGFAYKSMLPACTPCIT